MRRTRTYAGLAAVLVAACMGTGSSAGELKIPLTVSETAGQGRGPECVTIGVPFLPGQVKDAKTLRLLDADGKEVVAQFRELSRWWYKDNSLRWALVDFHTGVGDFDRKSFTVADGREKDYDSPLKVAQTDEAITVTTGPAQFTISRRKFNLFDRVRIDLNADGQFSDDEEAVSPNPASGSVVEDTFGQKYLSSEGTVEVKVEEAGPVRVCIVARGMHRAPEGKGYSRGMYGYDLRMHFYANKSLVRLDACINNASAQPIGSPTFEDFSLVTRLNLKPEVKPDDPEAPKLVMFRMYGVAPVDDELREGESAVIYQDSNGSETWKVNPGVEGKDTGDLSSFRGYRMTLKGKAGEKVLGSGDQARGLVAVGGEKFGAVIVPRYFWQQFPKAIEVAHDGTVRIGILPREYKAVHWLPDAGGAGQELWLLFYGRGMKKAPGYEYARDNQTRSQWKGLLRDRPWPHVVADNVNPPLYALCPREHYAACGALADIGTYATINDDSGFPLAVTERRYFTTDYLKGNAYGWQVFGCRWEEYAGHSPWNYEPIWSTNYLWRAINTQHPTWMEFGWRRDMHTRNIRSCYIQGTKPFEYKDWGSFSANNVCEEWCKRAAPNDEELKKYSAGKYARTEWYLPNPEHLGLDEHYDLYCLFGDSRALEIARNAAAVGGAYVGTKKVGIGRDTGWCFRTLMRYYDLTGSEECRDYVAKAMDNFWEVARANRSTPRINYGNDWFYNVFSRSVVLAHNVTGDERMRDLVIGLAQGRTDAKSKFPVQNAFAWDQTGNPKYLSEKPEKYIKLGDGGYDDYMPCCNAYLWMKLRPDKAAPAAVKDLTAEPAGAGEAKLSWTAPGDDGTEGQAAVYQVKWSDITIVELAKGGGECSFWGAENVAGEPAPKKAGEKEEFTVKGLKPGTYHFALKARDECSNESPISNVVKVEVK
ncbi:MAG TPA: hypothetical protein PK280_15300 [Planctomycetota bacterium]|nr:hypothetical protein [Planctomycetota bacterium]